MSKKQMERPVTAFAPGERKAAFTVDFPFTKSATSEKGNLELRGYASTWVEDRDGEFVDPGAFDKSLPNYLAKNPIILWQHEMDKPIGTMRDASVDANGLNVVVDVLKPTAKEPDWKHLAYESIKKGIVKTFSIGGFFEREFVMGRAVIKTVELMELSVVSIPSNPDSIFEAAAKSIKGGSHRPRLLQGHIKQMRQILGADELTDPELIVMTPAERVMRYELIAEAYRKAGFAPPEIDEFQKLQSELATIGTREQAVDLTPRMTAFIRKVNGGMEEKGIRILTRMNEGKLRDVRTTLDGLEQRIDQAADEAKGLLLATRTELDVVLKSIDEEDEQPDPIDASEAAQEDAAAADDAEDGDDGKAADDAEDKGDAPDDEEDPDDDPDDEDE